MTCDRDEGRDITRRQRRGLSHTVMPSPWYETLLAWSLAIGGLTYAGYALWHGCQAMGVELHQWGAS